MLTLLGLAAPGCKSDPAPSSDESSSSSTTGEPPPIPCDDDMPCPEESQSCLVGLCFDGDGPTIEITSPINEQQLDWTEGAPTQAVTIVISGKDFNLVAAADDPDSARGSGQVVLTLDNFEVAVIESGDLGEGISVTVDSAALAGAHRLHAFARLSDGTAYDNPESTFDSLFWFNDGKPHVAFNSPLPGQRFLPGAQQIEITLATINFAFSQASAEIEPGRAGIGHIYVDQNFPACANDEACAAGYIGVLSPMSMTSHVTAAIDIPTANGAKTKLTAHLARTDHSPYCVDDAEPCVPVFETITIGRLEPPPEDETSSGGGADTTTTTGGGATGSTGE
ncbi:MAG: hypothetical protein IAG13_10640 [Deltaproteobacteria bacterium]|nr:hypothetical protein [Nannocystaceae bacterium]